MPNSGVTLGDAATRLTSQSVPRHSPGSPIVLHSPKGIRFKTYDGPPQIHLVRQSRRSTSST